MNSHAFAVTLLRDSATLSTTPLLRFLFCLRVKATQQYWAEIDTDAGLSADHAMQHKFCYEQHVLCLEQNLHSGRQCFEGLAYLLELFSILRGLGRLGSSRGRGLAPLLSLLALLLHMRWRLRHIPGY